MKLYGLTGGTGSGKSLAGRYFEEHGIPVIDADALGHALIAPGGEAESQVIETFGEAILSSDTIDREKLGKMIFSNSDAREELNALLHPLIIAETQRRAGAFATDGKTVVLMDAALLAEKGELDSYLSGLVLVLAPEVLRLRRLTEARGMTEDAAKRQITAQMPPEEKRALADFVIENDGTEAVLAAQVAVIAEALLHDVI